MTEKTAAPDWGRIEHLYRAGLLSVREIAASCGVSHTAIQKKAKAWCWDRERQVKTKPVTLPRDDMDRSGFVYVIYLDDSANERFYKIGMAASFGSRFGAHQCASPFDICVAMAYFSGNMRTEERELHALFSSKRVRGEWFRLNHDDLQQIAKRALIL